MKKTNQLLIVTLIVLGTIHFENKESWVNGIFTSTSLRYWPKVYTSLEGNKEEYFNRISESQETHKASNIGIANTPIIFNLAVGYSIVF